MRQSAAGQEFTTRVRPEVLEAGSDISATLALSEDIVPSQYLSAWKQKQLFPCLKMQPVLQNAKSVFGNIPVKVTSVAKWSFVLLGPLRDDIKHASELSHPRAEEAWGFSFRFNHHQLGITPRVFAWYSHLPVHRLRGGPQVENCRCWQREEWWVRALAALSYTCCGRGSSNDSRPCGKGRRWPLCPNCSGQKGLRRELWWHPWLSSPRESSRKDKCRAHVGRPLENSDFGKALKRDWRATTLYYGPLLCLKAVVAWAIQVPIEF